MSATPTRKPADWSGVIIGLILLPVYILFWLYGKEELGRSVFIILGMTMLAIRVRWDLRKRLWFWAIIISVLALQVPLLFLFRWPHGYHGWLPAVGTLPVGLADVLIILGAVSFVEKFIVKPRPAG
jgi:uncharacterized membrane protein YwaF